MIPRNSPSPPSLAARTSRDPKAFADNRIAQKFLTLGVSIGLTRPGRPWSSSDGPRRMSQRSSNLARRSAKGARETVDRGLDDASCWPSRRSIGVGCAVSFLCLQGRRSLVDDETGPVGTCRRGQLRLSAQVPTLPRRRRARAGRGHLRWPGPAGSAVLAILAVRCSWMALLDDDVVQHDPRVPQAFLDEPSNHHRRPARRARTKEGVARDTIG